MSNTWHSVPNNQIIEETVANLGRNGIEATVVDTKAEALEKLLSLIPEGSEVMTMTSVTLDTIGATEILNRTEGQYRPVRDRLYSMDKATQAQEMNKLGATPEYAVGSVHAVTQEGSVLIASNTGSQLPAYAYAALNVIWVVGAQKIVKNTEEGIKRIYEHSYPLEKVRAKKAYGIDSNVSKILMIHKEVNPHRLKMIIIKESIGF